VQRHHNECAIKRIIRIGVTIPLDIQVETIDKVIKKTVEVLEKSKYQIFEICENAQSERDSLNNELSILKLDLDQIIIKVDKLDHHYRLSRIRLTEVSRDFDRYQEEDIRKAYEAATNIQMDLSISREKEVNLKARRDELHLRIRNSDRTIERAEALGSQMSVVLEYMSGDMSQVTRILESAKNRQLIGLKIIMAQEEERKRISREIHDSVAQSIANVVLRAEIAEKMMTKQDLDGVKSEVHELKAQARLGLEEIRKIIFNLRPMALDDLGLIPIMRKFTQDFEEKTKIRTKFTLHGKESRLPSAMEVAVFRLAQEAFTNVLKHAEASFVSLDITYQSKMVKITVQDNGKGFQVDAMHAKLSSGSHFGIIGMQERVDLLEGRFEIESNMDGGTKIDMLIPIKMDNGKEKESQ
jgi:two-component system sensor histidine kinase DegS